MRKTLISGYHEFHDEVVKRLREAFQQNKLPAWNTSTKILDTQYYDEQGDSFVRHITVQHLALQIQITTGYDDAQVAVFLNNKEPVVFNQLESTPVEDVVETVLKMAQMVR